jgi:oligoribonuclease (3'-5' exoribonuclease)
MRLCALDLETSGRDPQKDLILQLGAVVFDTETKETLGTFQKLVHHERVQGETYALAMNADLLKEIDNGNGYEWKAVVGMLGEFLWDHFRDTSPCAVGFNVGPFDVAFINANTHHRLFHHRTIELGSLLMPIFASHEPVSSKQAAKLLNKEDLDHTALADAEDARDLYFYWLGFLESVKDNRLCLP